MTIIELIHKAFEQFEVADLYYGHGTDNAWDEAVALVFQTLRIPFDVDDNRLEDNIKKEDAEKVLALMRRRIDEKIPLAYLTQEAYFAGYPFYVDERVIIPRSPFAELIEHQFIPWIQPEKINRVLDLCTGSGCMAIATALHLPQVKVDAVELSKEAMDVAQKNIQRYELEDRVRVFESDLFKNLPQMQYDLIISNPPYVSDDEMKALPAEFKKEPDMALRAKDEGLVLALRIIQQASRFLTNDGVLIVEVGNSQEALEKRLPKMPFVWLDFERGGQGVFVLQNKSLK